jgi:hypothetical protein
LLLNDDNKDMKLRLITRSISIAAVSVLLTTLLAPNAALAAGPTNTVLPTISGTLAVDQTVIAGSGSWDVTPSSITYQWNRCSTTEITSCVQITGANAGALKLLPADGGNFLRLQVTALSAGGGTTASSAISGRVLTQPTASVIPVITGVVQVGSALTISNGTWINVIAPIFTYKWQRCSSLEISSCTDISLATNTTYILSNADVASYIRGTVTVTATANNLVATSTSEPTPQLISEPTLITSPAITGTAVTDETLTATTGSYNAYPAPTFSYQWQSCTSQDLATCSPISGANQATYTLLAGNVGRYLRVMVTAANNLGGRVSPSSLTGVVMPATVPNNSSLPVISGIVRDRQTLNVTSGSWSGNPVGIISYQWQRCSDRNQSDCTDLIGETRTSYNLTFNDVNKYIRAQVTSKNRVGTGTIISALTNQIMYATQLQSAPFAIGFAQVGQKWIATPGTWVGAESPSFGYQWQNCASLDASTCTDIPGATQVNYTAQTPDIGKYLRLKNWVVGQSSPAFSDIAPVKITAAPKSILSPPKTAVKAKKVTITCIKGKLTKKVTGSVPKCPTGYKKK